MLKQRLLHRKQNPLFSALAWLYIYWTHTFPKSSNSLYKKVMLCSCFTTKGKLCVITFTCKWFLTFQCFILKFSKKVQSPRIPDFGVLGPESWVLSPRSQVLDSGSWVPGPGSWVLGPASLVLGSRSWVLGPESWVTGSGSRSWVLGPGSWVLSNGSWLSGPWSWVLILDYARQNCIFSGSSDVALISVI